MIEKNEWKYKITNIYHLFTTTISILIGKVFLLEKEIFSTKKHDLYYLVKLFSTKDSKTYVIFKDKRSTDWKTKHLNI